MFDDDEEDEDYGTVMLLIIHPDPTKDDKMIVCKATKSGRVLMLQNLDGRPIVAICQAPEEPEELKN